MYIFGVEGPRSLRWGGMEKLTVLRRGVEEIKTEVSHKKTNEQLQNTRVLHELGAYLHLSPVD